MRYGLNALLAVAILTGTAEADEADAIKRIEKLHGSVKRDDGQPGKPVVAVELNGTEATDSDLQVLKELKQLTSLNLGGCSKMTDAGLKVLKELPQLTSLDLNQTWVTDTGLKELKELKQLRELDLWSCWKVTDVGLKELKMALPRCKISR